MRKAKERQALNYDKRCSAVTFESGDLVFVNFQALRGSQEGYQLRKLVTRSLEPFAILVSLNALAYIIDMRVAWCCHKSYIGFLKNIKESTSAFKPSRLRGLGEAPWIALRGD